MPIVIPLNDIVRMRKPHPCGGYEWRVVRLGADVGLKCQTCERRVLLPRGEFERRLKAIVRRDAVRRDAVQRAPSTDEGRLMNDADD